MVHGRSQALIPQDAAQSMLTPHIETLVICFHEAWGKWKDVTNTNPAFTAPLAARSRASCVNDHIWNAVVSRFTGVDEVHIVEKNGLRTICIANQLILRFKKLNRKLQSCNIGTAQQHAFAQQLAIPGIPEATRLTVGYLLDRLQTEIATVVVTLPYGSAIVWSFQLPALEAQIEVRPFTHENEPSRTRTVRVKKMEQGDATQTGTNS